MDMCGQLHSREIVNVNMHANLSVLGFVLDFMINDVSNYPRTRHKILILSCFYNSWGSFPMAHHCLIALCSADWTGNPAVSLCLWMSWTNFQVFHETTDRLGQAFSPWVFENIADLKKCTAYAPHSVAIKRSKSCIAGARHCPKKLTEPFLELLSTKTGSPNTPEVKRMWTWEELD